MHEAEAFGAAADRGEVGPRERNAACARAHDAQNHARERRLAAPRLADDRKYLRPLGAHLEAHVVDGVGAAAEQAAGAIRLDDVADGEERRAHRGRSFGPVGALPAGAFVLALISTAVVGRSGAAGNTAKHATR